MAVTDSRPYANAFLAANPTNIDGYQGGDAPIAYSRHQPDGPELGTPIPSERCGDIAMRLDPDIKRDVEDELRSDPDNIEVRPQVPSIEIKRKIEEALRRAAEIDASRITVEANGSEITLRGTVRSWAEREQAERAAWSDPGVSKVDNRIRIDA
jgi:osmotically-inducible protein OsmY